jgi:peptide/nickel transport system permease protein
MRTEMSTPIPDAPVPAPEEELVKEEEAKVMVASQAQLIWWKFRRHKLAMAAGVFVLLIYAVAGAL